ncbi:2'-5' RNA ligase family protein [Flavobacterium agrisoli]|uniref:2'-5' RNA ligase family protein n=1 Tax=Flavobacterium agrisoli TaxID=2793066 RepID=A0A934PIZ0_9FLAO|nr:2'-5' RNA ligase family protein [Flavobacterium agrisoli]MBK0368967.1 2'-5' RNA ligase family protein [Flavobacterium agrisoli]
MTSKYSIVFMPDADWLEKITTMKFQLSDLIGWYSSKNALGHITICEFEMEEKNFPLVLKKLSQICDSLSSKKVFFDHYEAFESNGTFFIAPSSESKKYLSDLMKRINQSILIKDKFTSNTPHLSIARKLTSEQMQVAFQTFQKISMEFHLKSLYVRRFNKSRKQYDVIHEIEFVGNDEVGALFGQQSLF